jgi:hypothetical protein
MLSHVRVWRLAVILLLFESFHPAANTSVIRAPTKPCPYTPPSRLLHTVTIPDIAPHRAGTYTVSTHALRGNIGLRMLAMAAVVGTLCRSKVVKG